MKKTFSKKKKAEVLKIALEHQEMDRFAQGAWLQENQVEGLFRGCFLGCMTQSSENTLQKASEEMQIPLWLVYVSERLFEGLPSSEALMFPVDLLKSVPTNKDLTQAWKDWNIFVLTDQLRFTEEGSDQFNAIIGVIEVYQAETISRSAARSARSAAWSAESAAWSAWSAAWSAWSAAWSAESAAWSAESAARSARSAARSDHYSFLKQGLIDILKSCNE